VAASLNPLDTPHTYIQDGCQYLKDKWTSTNSAPGTVVMVVMFHSISKAAATDANQISAEDFGKLMRDLHDGGFTAINTQELSDFLYSNALIPVRSVLLVVDDRHFAEYFTDHFQPYFEKYQWPVVNAYIAKDERPDLWQQNAQLSAAGWVDYQAHGVIHNIPIDAGSSDSYITGELQGAITNLQKYFNKTPIAYIWPGGGFTPHAAQMARQFGYRLGFTINPRGPVMFNWIPLGDQADPRRPYFIADGPVNDPLMVLPRYWDVDARSHLDQVRQISNDAAAFAEQNKATELQYYDIVCAPKLGPIP
jgi:peptidoglycan/xylan/chitin deacetylase (PgdA/CDA1 family)